MAQRTEKDGKPSNESQEAMTALNNMLAQGRSFSGNERNCCFLNLAGKRFATVSAVSGLDFPDDGRSVAAVDWDQDGDLDLWIANRNAPRLRLMRNDAPAVHHFLRLRLQGNGTGTNRDAVGARVELVLKNAKEKPLIRTLRAGEGLLSQSSHWLHFGLGNNREIEKVIVRWPAGEAEVFTGLDANQQYIVRQGTGAVKRWSKTKRTNLVLKRSPQTPPEVSGSTRIPLATRLPMPHTMAYSAFNGSKKRLQLKPGKSTLIVLFGSWCGPCREELSELAERHKDLRAAELRWSHYRWTASGKMPRPRARLRLFARNLNFHSQPAKPTLNSPNS